MKTLLVTPRMLKIAKEEKACGTYKMRVYDFLQLTTTQNVFDFEKEEREQTLALDQYNDYVRSGDINLMPFLDVDMDTGHVQGHEGRHRALSVAAADSWEARMDVAIYLRRKGYKIYYTNPYVDGPDRDKWLIKKFVNKDDVPERLIGQFRHSTVYIDRDKFEEFYPSKVQTSSTAIQRLNLQL